MKGFPIIVTLAIAWGAGCVNGTLDSAAPSPSTAIEISGSWVSSWGEEMAIDATRWGSSALVFFDNEARVAITRYAEDDPYSPGRFAKQIWIEDDASGFWQCTVVFDAETLEDALADPTSPDATKPDEGGCGGFPWTHWRRPLEIAGSYVTNWDETYQISAFAWGNHVVIDHDNDANWLIIQFSPDDEWNPNLFAKQVWTEPAPDGSFWQCTVVFDAESLAAVRADSSTPDATDPAEGGCGEYPWTKFQISQ